MDTPCGTFNDSYNKDFAIVRTRLQWGLFIAFLLFVLLFPLFPFATSRILNFLITTAIVIIAVQGVNILTGCAGQITLGQAAFMAVGGYIFVLLSVNLGWSFWACLLCGAIGSALMGLLFGLPALKIKGFYIAMTTLAAQFIIIYLIFVIPNITGGGEGLTIPHPQVFGITIRSPQDYYYLVIPITILMIFFAKSLLRTRVGRAFIAIRDNDLAAETMGINIFRYKVLAFAICSFYAGIAGVLRVTFLGIAHPDLFPLMDSLWFLGMVIVGGMGSVLGSILGPIFLIILTELAIVITPLIAGIIPVATAGALGIVLQALVIIVFLIAEPRGLAHRWQLIKTSYRLWPFSRVLS